MVKKKITIRRSKTISPNGVGAILDIEGESFVAADVSMWDQNGETIIAPPLLAAQLGFQKLLIAPEAQDFRSGNTPPRKTPYYRFPRELFCPKCRRMHEWDYKDEKKLAEEQQKAEQECSEAIKQTRANADRVIMEIQKQIEDQIAIKRQLFEQITMEIERMNQEYHEYKVFCRTAKQQFIQYYPIIVTELFEAIEFIKTLKGSLTEKERKELTKIMRKVKTLDIGMFVEYTQKGTAFKSSDITVTELYEIEKMLQQEIQTVKKVKISTWKEIQW